MEEARRLKALEIIGRIGLNKAHISLIQETKDYEEYFLAREKYTYCDFYKYEAVLSEENYKLFKEVFKNEKIY